MEPMLLKQGERVSWRGVQGATVVWLAGKQANPLGSAHRHDALIRTDDGSLHDVMIVGNPANGVVWIAEKEAA